MPKTLKTEIREGTDFTWVKPIGFDYSIIQVIRPDSRQYPVGLLETPASIAVSPRENMTPQQAVALSAALRTAAVLAETYQLDFERSKKQCPQKPKQETYSSAGRSPRASPRRRAPSN